jgi:polyisoprenoid-binding protein YceI
MLQRVLGFLCAVVAVSGLCTPAQAGDTYAVDTAHAAVNFRISHLGLSWTHGRFNELSGSFTIDDDPAKCQFELTIKTESIDTGNAQRDTHLKSPDFFNAKQFPAISFKSTSVKAAGKDLEVTGDFTLHGVTKPITFTMVGGKKAEFPKGTHRTGYSTELTIKRADFGIDKFNGAVGDDVHVAVSFEGTKK